MSHGSDTLVVMGIKVLHCADLHLDAVLSGGLKDSHTEYVASQDFTLLRDAPLLALENIAFTATNENIDIVLIAGDLFNMKEDAALNHRVRSHLMNFFKKLEKENIKVFVCVGNHDPIKYISEISKSWPENVYLFKNKKVETITIEIRNQKVNVHGVSYAKDSEDRNLASMFPKKVSGEFNLALLHTNVGGDINHSNYAPSELKTLTSYAYDYFALGHIHKRTILSENPLIAYSGNHQGLSPKPSECEAKGVIVFETDEPNSNFKTQFVETDVVRYVNETLLIKEASSLEELSESICEYLENKYENTKQLVLCRLLVNLENYEGSFLEATDLIDLVNENVNNIILSKIKINTDNKNFDELVDISEYFQSIQFQLENIDELSFDELYGKQSSKIITALDLEEKDSISISEKEIKNYLTNIHNELLGKVK